jgi:hypothetical protein
MKSCILTGTSARTLAIVAAITLSANLSVQHSAQADTTRFDARYQSFERAAMAGAGRQIANNNGNSAVNGDPTNPFFSGDQFTLNAGFYGMSTSDTELGFQFNSVAQFRSIGEIDGSEMGYGINLGYERPFDRDSEMSPRFYANAGFAMTQGQEHVGLNPGGTTGPFSAVNYIDRAPDGTTGLFFASSGQEIDVHSHTFMGKVSAGVKIPFSKSKVGSAGMLYTYGGIGGQYTFNWGMTTVKYDSVTFGNQIAAEQNFMSDDHVFAAQIALGARLAVARRIFFGVEAHVSPGVMFSKGQATHTNKCSVCTGFASNGTQHLEQNETRFAVNAGAKVEVGVVLSDRVQFSAYGGGRLLLGDRTLASAGGQSRLCRV